MMLLGLPSCYTPGKRKYYAIFTVEETQESSHRKVTDITESWKRLEETLREHLAHALAPKQEKLCLSLILYSH